MQLSIPPSWKSILDKEINKEYFNDLSEYIKSEYWVSQCFPEENDIFRAFLITPFWKCESSDPWSGSVLYSWELLCDSHSQCQTDLAYNRVSDIFKELESDIGFNRKHTDLTHWAEQGVLLLNSVLTVRSGETASHAGKWWSIYRYCDSDTFRKRWGNCIYSLGHQMLSQRVL